MAINPNHRISTPDSRGAIPETSLVERLAKCHVGVRNDLEVSRHVFLGEISYILRDPISFDGHNFSATDYEILISLVDDHSLGEIFEQLKLRNLLQQEQAEDFYRFVIELQARGLLSLPVTDGEKLYQQYELKRQRRAGNLLMKLLFFKIPLGCPDAFLKSTYLWFRPLFTQTFFAFWVIGLLAATVIAVSRWDTFASELSSQLALQNLPAMLLVLSGLKLWHELGHGYACRHYGIAVPNAGLMFMFGTPLAFVDATGSWSLSQRRHRQVINLAGIYFETMVAIAATFIWTVSTNTSVQSLAHFTILISSVTTIGFNCNPLLKYDGYFVLADSLGIPNLRGRAAFATTETFKRLLFGIRRPQSAPALLQMILVAYGISAAVYKWLLVMGISIMLAMQIWLAGLLVAGMYLVNSVGAVLTQVVRYLLWSEELKDKRGLATTYLVLLVIGGPVLLLSCPWPGRSQARGIAECSSIRVIHVADGGFLFAAHAKPGESIEAGELLAEIENIDQESQRQHKLAELDQLEMKYRSELLVDRDKANQMAQQVKHLRYDLDMHPTIDDVKLVRAPVSGQVLVSAADRNSGMYLAPGAELMRIGTQGWRIRAAISTRSLADLKPEVGQLVHCRFHADPTQTHEAVVREICPAGSRIVAHEALTHLAGGFIPVNPETMEATEPYFELVLHLTDTRPACLINGAVCEIRFPRKYEPLGRIIYRSLLSFVNQLSLK
jgi:putative peptide zinc metalloprotease protein